MRRLGVLLLVLIAASGGCAVWIEHELSHPYRGYTEAKIFVDIPWRTSRWGAAGLLKGSGVIRSRVAFAALSEWHRRKVLQAGEYLFDRPMAPREVFAQIVAGRIYVHTITVPEGWTMFDIAHALEREGLCSSEDFLKVARDPSLVRDIAPSAPSLEGFLFPATYQFTRHATPQEIAATMVRHFRDEWQKLEAENAPAAPSETMPDIDPRPEKVRAHRDVGPNGPSQLSTEQIVTLASLVERETPQPKERPLVAGVFYNRLCRTLPLQSDPTVAYALELAGEATRDVTPEELRFPSTYNTYLHRGLPPGPVASPGEASLDAALHPAPTDYLYFVANDQGGHFFSRTLAEHNRNVARYRRLLAGIATPVTAPSRVAASRGRKHHPKRSTRRKTRRHE